MAFDIDILIVFADPDNEPTGKNDIGWVSQFKKFLEFMLLQVLTEKPKILLKGEFDTMTSPKLDNVGVMIPILSKEFVKSPLCSDHVDSFYSAIVSHPKFKIEFLKYSNHR